jgi:hypothetical protein
MRGVYSWQVRRAGHVLWNPSSLLNILRANALFKHIKYTCD